MAQLQNAEILLYYKTHLPYFKVYCNRYSPIWMKNISHHQANTRIWNRSWLLKRTFFENVKTYVKGSPWNIIWISEFNTNNIQAKMVNTKLKSFPQFMVTVIFWEWSQLLCTATRLNLVRLISMWGYFWL